MCNINAHIYASQHKNKNSDACYIISSKDLTLSTLGIYLSRIINRELGKQSPELKKLGTTGLKPKLIKYFVVVIVGVVE